MRPHPYLRAYMAGIAMPTAGLVIAVTIFTIARYGMGLDVPIERALVFPLAVVPSAWGVWNMLHLALPGRLRLRLGLHGAILPILLLPAGAFLGRAFGIFDSAFQTAALFSPVAIAFYYLAWKYVVGFLNAEVGVA